jgi:hypothetical protein
MNQLHPLPELPLVFDDKLAPNGALVFDNSTLELLRCPRLFEYKALRKREVVGAKAGRNFGAGLHVGWATRYRRCGSSAVADADTVAINDSMGKFFAESPSPGEDFRNFDHACRVMRVYNEIYGREEFKIVTNPKDGSPMVECSFLLPFGVELDGHPLYYCGKIDTGIEDNSGIWSFDHKSAFQFGDGFDGQMQRDGGQLGYMWALWQVLGVRPKGYIIDAVRIRRPSVSKKAEYGGGTPPVDGTDMKRLPFAVATDDIIEAWKKDVVALVKQILHFHKSGHFPEYRWQCVGKYGKCDMYEACAVRPEERLNILYHTSLFTESTWSPLNAPKNYE